MQDYVKVMGKDLVHIHISDRDRLPPGAGGTDFRPLIDALKEVGYTGFLTQEVAFASRGINPDASAMKGLLTQRRFKRASMLAFLWPPRGCTTY